MKHANMPKGEKYYLTFSINDQEALYGLHKSEHTRLRKSNKSTLTTIMGDEDLLKVYLCLTKVFIHLTQIRMTSIIVLVVRTSLFDSLTSTAIYSVSLIPCNSHLLKTQYKWFEKKKEKERV